MPKMQLIPCSKAKNDEHFERNRVREARPIPCGAFTELSGIPADKREVWNFVQQDAFLEGLVRTCGLTWIEWEGKKWQKSSGT